MAVPKLNFYPFNSIQSLYESTGLNDDANAEESTLGKVVNAVEGKSTDKSDVTFDNLEKLLETYSQTFANSAAEAEAAAVEAYNKASAKAAEEERAWNEKMWEDEKLYNSEQARLARNFSADEAQKNRDYQTEMANTTYQRAVKDLEAAGLNPLLAYSNLSTSSVSGATASSSAASASAPSTSSRSVAKANATSAKQADTSAYSSTAGLISLCIAAAKDLYKIWKS